MSSGFQPKQVTQYEASHLAELMGNLSETIIDYALDLIPPIESTDIIHDNACGAAVVSQALIAKASPASKGFEINATDINPQFVMDCEQAARLNKWPLKAQVMDARDLQFPDNHFTRSFNNFAFHSMDVAKTSLKEVFRTLKPGGTVMVSAWNDMPHSDSIKHAHRRTRGEDCPLPLLLQDMSFEEEHMKQALNEAGFEPAKTHIYQKDAYVTIPDKKRWAQLAWSYLGILPSGWLQEDEEKWQEAVDDIVDHLLSGNGISKNDNGETVMRFKGSIAIATR